MTTAAPVSGTASTLVLDTARPEVERRPVGRGDAVAMRALTGVDARQRHRVGTVLLAGRGVSRIVLALDGVPA